jgi:hypothetical protein
MHRTHLSMAKTKEDNVNIARHWLPDFIHTVPEGSHTGRGGIYYFDSELGNL